VSYVKGKRPYTADLSTVSECFAVGEEKYTSQTRCAAKRQVVQL